MIGKKFGRLTVIEDAGRNKYHIQHYKCICDCGNYKKIAMSSLTLNRTKSCGCISRENAINKNTKHGLKNTRLNRIWSGMKTRCNNPNATGFKNYGGKGIKVCEEWEENFLNFYNWALKNGYTDDLTIERIDINKNYEPNNCTWIPKKEQSRNQSTNRIITINGESKLLIDWSREYDIPKETIKSRLDRGVEGVDLLLKAKRGSNKWKCQLK